jgi:regulatory protein
VLDPRARGQVNVFLDGRYAFALRVATAAQLELGARLSPEQTTQLQQADRNGRSVEAALRFVAGRPRSAQELSRHLAGKGFGADEIAHAQLRLAELDLLDDLEFARWWVANRTAHRPRGRFALAHELAARGVERAVVREALSDVDESVPAARLARDQAERHRHLGRYEFERRVGAFLQRRGFAADVIRGALDSAWSEPGPG